MPYYLVIILTPKIVYLNQKNDVIIKRSLVRQEDTDLEVDQSQITIP